MCQYKETLINVLLHLIVLKNRKFISKIFYLCELASAICLYFCLSLEEAETEPYSKLQSPSEDVYSETYYGSTSVKTNAGKLCEICIFSVQWLMLKHSCGSACLCSKQPTNAALQSLLCLTKVELLHTFNIKSRFIV